MLKLRSTLLVMSFFVITVAHATGGLRRLIVERYHRATPEEVAASNGKLTLNAVTYRLYVELLPGYKFITCYGSPQHPLKITTSTSFYNHPKGAQFANAITQSAIAKDPLLALDTWLSVGAANANQLGVYNGTAVDGVPNEVTVIGIDKQLQFLAYSEDSVKTPQTFETTNGAWACLKGATGPSTDDNTVLIGQFTTDGALALGLNFVIGAPAGTAHAATGEYFVNRNPVGAEIQLPPPTFTVNPLFKP